MQNDSIAENSYRSFLQYHLAALTNNINYHITYKYSDKLDSNACAKASLEIVYYSTPLFSHRLSTDIFYKLVRVDYTLLFLSFCFTFLFLSFRFIIYLCTSEFVAKN